MLHMKSQHQVGSLGAAHAAERQAVQVRRARLRARVREADGPPSPQNEGAFRHQTTCLYISALR